MLPAFNRAAEPTDRIPTCRVFRWIGQSFEHCATCELPYWEHLYDPTFDGDRPLFHVKQFYPRTASWLWVPVGKIITRAAAAACRATWEGTGGSRSMPRQWARS